MTPVVGANLRKSDASALDYHARHTMRWKGMNGTFKRLLRYGMVGPVIGPTHPWHPAWSVTEKGHDWLAANVARHVEWRAQDAERWASRCKASK